MKITGEQYTDGGVDGWRRRVAVSKQQSAVIHVHRVRYASSVGEKRNAKQTAILHENRIWHLELKEVNLTCSVCMFSCFCPHKLQKHRQSVLVVLVVVRGEGKDLVACITLRWAV